MGRGDRPHPHRSGQALRPSPAPRGSSAAHQQVAPELIVDDGRQQVHQKQASFKRKTPRSAGQQVWGLRARAAPRGHTANTVGADQKDLDDHGAGSTAWTHLSPSLPGLVSNRPVPPACPATDTEDRGHQWSQAANRPHGGDVTGSGTKVRRGHRDGQHWGPCHRGQTCTLVPPPDPPGLTDQGEHYEEDGVGPVLGIRGNHH